jgi:hypothetical protein
MREQVLDYIKGINLGAYNLSDDIPREENGTALFVKNPKRIYVSSEDFTETPLLNTFSGFNLHTYSILLTVVFSSDAKKLPQNYASLVALLLSAKDINTTEGFNSREASVSTVTENDLLVTQIEYSFTEIR